MATQSYIFTHEDTLCAAQEAVMQLREALAIESRNADIAGSFYAGNADAWYTVRENACTLAKLASLLMGEVDAAMLAADKANATK